MLRRMTGRRVCRGPRPARHGRRAGSPDRDVSSRWAGVAGVYPVSDRL